MSQEQMIRTVAETAPVTDADVAVLDLEQGESELLEAIMNDPAREPRPVLRAGRASGLRQRRFAVRMGAALAGAAVAAALVLSGNEPGGDDGGDVAYAANWVRIAEDNARLLVTAPGWQVTRADEYRPNSGEMTFSNGKHEVDVYWQPAEYYEADARDPSYAKPNREIDVVGREATLIRYEGSTEYIVLLPPEGPTYIEIRGDLGSEEAYLDLIGSIERTDVETWLSALPESVVRPVDRVATVDEMLEAIPLPPGFDVASLRNGETVKDRYQLGALVTGAVTCAWLERRMSGLASGDTARVNEAEAALATAPTWPILLELEPQGAWSQEVWDWAEDGRGATSWGRDTTENPVGSLGCHARVWRDVPQVDPRARTLP